MWFVFVSGQWYKKLLFYHLFSLFRKNLDLDCQGERALYPFDVLDCTFAIESGNKNERN